MIARPFGSSCPVLLSSRNLFIEAVVFASLFWLVSSARAQEEPIASGAPAEVQTPLDIRTEAANLWELDSKSGRLKLTVEGQNLLSKEASSVELPVPIERDGQTSFVTTKFNKLESQPYPDFFLFKSNPSVENVFGLEIAIPRDSDGDSKTDPFAFSERRRSRSSALSCRTRPAKPPGPSVALPEGPSRTVYKVRLRFVLSSSFRSAAARYLGGPLESPSEVHDKAALKTIEGVLRQIFLRDLGVDLEIKFTVVEQAQEDPFRGIPMGDSLLGKVAPYLNGRGVPAGCYDVAHLLLNGNGGGLAHVGGVGTDKKALGATSADLMDFREYVLSYLAHELGHQLGANHTFAGKAHDCGTARHEAAAYEVGSGGTIMGYTGLCGPDQVYGRVLPCFHAKSVHEIRATLSKRAKPCKGATRVKTSERSGEAPLVWGSSFEVLPIRTPFLIEARVQQGAEEEAVVTFEQWDLAQSGGLAVTDPDPGSGPLFRCQSPADLAIAPLDTNASDDSTKVHHVQRHVPDLGTLSYGPFEGILFDRVPEVGRDMKIRLRARDKSGRSSEADVLYEFTPLAGPFKVIGFGPSGTKSALVKWDMGNTEQPPVSEREVRIQFLVSSKGEGKFLASNLLLGSDQRFPNNGQATVTLPPLEEGTRVWALVRGATRPFFAMSPNSIVIDEKAAINKSTGDSVGDKSPREGSASMIEYRDPKSEVVLRRERESDQ